jgi:hypothetical protein
VIYGPQGLYITLLGVKNMDHESRINAALGKILRNFNFLEKNLGHCLGHLENPDSPSKSYKYLNRAGMPQTIKRLKKLLDESEHLSDTSGFHEWIVSADEIRALRNYYAHATWDYLPLSEDAPLQFSIPPWRKETIKGANQGRMRMEDLEADANRIESIFNDFMVIRRKYGV